MALLTTTIGAYPKPDYVRVADWWRVRGVGIRVAVRHPERVRRCEDFTPLDENPRVSAADGIYRSHTTQPHNFTPPASPDFSRRSL